MRNVLIRQVTVSLILIAVLVFPVAAFASDVTVRVGHNLLEPAKVSISVGDTVTFYNQARMPGGHTIVADDGSFESPALDKDASWSRTFTKPGSYSYHIKQHPGTKGEIVVSKGKAGKRKYGY